ERDPISGFSVLLSVSDWSADQAIRSGGRSSDFAQERSSIQWVHHSPFCPCGTDGSQAAVHALRRSGSTVGTCQWTRIQRGFRQEPENSLFHHNGLWNSA